MLQLVMCGTMHKGNFVIGKNDDLLFKLKDDTMFLKNLTCDTLHKDSKLQWNVVIMGRKTYFSIPKNFRPLKNRINLILTRDPNLLKDYPMHKNFDLKPDVTYFVSYESFWKMYKNKSPNVFVLGGSQIYNYLIDKCDKLYITYVREKNKTFDQSDNLVYANCPFDYFKLIGYSSNYIYTNGSYRILVYKKTNKQSEEWKYLDFMKNILNNGKHRIDRTNVGTLSIFGNKLEFDVSSSIPLMTTKFISFKNIVEELLWFCRGDTDANILKNKGVNIWNHNTSRKFLDSQGLTHYPEGILGPGYGFQWRHFGEKYNYSYKKNLKGFDQLKNIEYLLKNDPFSRRIVLSAWNPPDFEKTALVPCHILLQFYVEEVNSIKYLNLVFYMRSNDVFLAITYNIVSYTILLYILCKKYDMVPKNIIYMSGDAHIYTNHIEQVEKLITRKPRPFPKLKVNDSVKTKDWNDITIEDFDLIGYFPYPSIAATIN